MLIGLLASQTAAASTYYGSNISVADVAYGWSYTESDSSLDAAYLGAIGVQATFETPDATYTSQWEIAPVMAANNGTFVEWLIGPADTYYSGSYLELGTHLLTTWPVAVNIYYYSNAYYFLPSD